MTISLSVSLSEASFSPANNSSTVKIVIKCKTSNGEWSGSAHSGKASWSGGTSSGSYSFSHSIGKNTTTTLSSKTVTVKHKADGTASIKVSASFKGVGHSCSASKTLTLSKTPTYTLTYNANGGTGAPASVKGLYGTVVKLSGTPTKPGSTFNGWGTSETATTVNSTITLSSNKTVYAVWTAIPYKVTANLNNGEEPLTFIHYNGDWVDDVPNPIRAGYTFTGWQVLGATTYPFYMPTQDVTLNALWTPVNVNHSYHYITDSSEVTTDLATVTSFTKVYNPDEPLLPPDLTLPGFIEKIGPYQFDYWASTPNGNALYYIGNSRPSSAPAISPTQKMTYIDTDIYGIYRLSESPITFLNVDALRIRVNSTDPENVRTWVSRAEYEPDASTTEALITFTFNNSDPTVNAVSLIYNAGEVHPAFTISVDWTSGEWVKEYGGVLYRLCRIEDVFYLYVRDLPKEEVPFFLQLIDSNSASVEASGVIPYETVIADFNRATTVLRVGGTASEKTTWSDLPSDEHKPKRSDGNISTAELRTDWTLNMAADAILPAVVEELYIEAIIKDKDLLPIPEGGTSSSIWDATTPFLMAVGDSIDDKTSPKRITEEWLFKNLNLDGNSTIS